MLEDEIEQDFRRKGFEDRDRVECEAEMLSRESVGE